MEGLMRVTALFKRLGNITSSKLSKHRPASPISLVLLNVKKWISNDLCEQDYCISVVFEHEKEIALYAELQANIQTRTTCGFTE
jgi:hypothetical protein